MQDKTKKKIAKRLVSKGIRLLHRRQFKNALIKLNKAIELNSEDIRTYYARASIYSALGKSEEAIADYTTMLKYNSNDDKVYRYRGYLYLLLEEYNLAIEDFSKATTIRPTDFSSYIYKGKATRAIKDYEQAISCYTKAIEILNEEKLFKLLADCYKFRAEIYSIIGDTQNAEVDLCLMKEVQKLRDKSSEIKF